MDIVPPRRPVPQAQASEMPVILPASPRRRTSIRWGRLIVLVLAIAMAGAAAGGGAYYYMYLRPVGVANLAARPDDAAAVIIAVGKLMVLPVGEEPTVATVSDPSALTSEPFFAAASAGDKVLIYSKSGKAILYDPVGNKIKNIAPIGINAPPTTPAPAAPTPVQPKTSKTQPKAR